MKARHSPSKPLSDCSLTSFTQTREGKMKDIESVIELIGIATSQAVAATIAHLQRRGMLNVMIDPETIVILEAEIKADITEVLRKVVE